MTIAIGILATDGIVIAADSEISTNGDIKGIGGKLVAATQEMYGQTRSVGLAGAGSLGYYQALRLKAAQAALQGMCIEPLAYFNVEGCLESLLLDFYTKHVIPFAAYPDAPDVALIVGAWTQDVGMLFATDRTTIRQVSSCDAIGIGGTYALSILHNYWCPMSVESAAILAAYTISRVKFSVAACGKDTHIVLVRKESAKYLSRDLMAKCDHMLENYAVFQTESLLPAIGVREDGDHVKTGVDAMRTDFDSLRQAIKLSSSPSSHA